MNIDSFYRELIGFSPYQYQVKVAQLLLSGKNVIVSIPTGAGKTWASIIPFLYAQQNSNIYFPQKMIYSLPLRTLSNSIYADVSEVLNTKDYFKNFASIHTGEYKNDEHFESDIIFSTIDQTLSNFLCFPLSLSKRQANINAGALIGSYLVFDEFHLMEPKLSMATTLGMLKMLKNLCRFCIMTATLSEKYINQLKNTLNAEVVSISDFPEDEVKINSLKIPKGHTEKKTVTVKDKTISADSILSHHKKKTIVICNRVEKAQALYNEIAISNLTRFENMSGFDNTNLICLHSRFFDEDRKSKEKELKRLFGKKNNESAILIATQVIEAGMDISCDIMHVEISPINSFLQRAGRCARWEEEHGKIYVYNILNLEEKEKLNIEPNDQEELAQIRAINNKYLPYDKTLSETTYENLKPISSLNKEISQKLVDKILSSREMNNYTLSAQSDFNRSKIHESWETCEKKMYSQTIRDIQSIDVAIIDYEKEQYNEFNPYSYQTIGLFKWTFIKWAKEILTERNFDDDVIFIAEINAESQFIDFDTNDIESYSLQKVRTLGPLKNCYDTIFVDKSIFKYTTSAGLEIGKGLTCSPIKTCKKEEKETIKYKKDTFWQHNKAIIGCYEQQFKPNLDLVYQQLDKYWGEKINWDKIIKTMICLHDYGKLNINWQKPMRALQKIKGDYDSNEVLAHSDFNELTDKVIAKQCGVNRKPPHAGIGAAVLVESAEELIEIKAFKEIANSVSTAILKHHGVDTEMYPDFEISNDGYQQIKKLLKELDIKTDLKQQARSGNLLDYLPTNTEEHIIYLFLVRILRLSDQKATINFEKYFKQ